MHQLDRCILRAVQATQKGRRVGVIQRRWISTINAEEVSHFDRLAATWWDPNGSSRLLHRMNPLRLSFITSLLPPTTDRNPSSTLRGQRVLDVGCGGGILTESLARLGAQVTGLDASPKAIQVANSHVLTDPKLSLQNPPTYICGSIHDHTQKDHYDIVTAMEVLEHVDYPGQFLEEVANCVKPGGWLVMSTISRNWSSWLGAIIASEKILRIVPEGTHSWEKFINEAELREFIGRMKGEEGKNWAMEVKSKTCMYNPLRGEWHFENGSRRVGFNYFLAARRAI